MRSLGLVVVAVGLALMLAADDAQMASESAEAAAREVIDDFFVAFNAENNEALQKVANYPHAFLLNNGRMVIANSADELVMNFDGMKAREGWHHSSLGEYAVSSSSAEKVHVELTFHRHHEDGTIYRTVPALWIVTKKDEHWGIQFRSLMPASFELKE